MTIILLLTSLAGLTGFLLSIYFFFYRLRLTKVWRWLGGIVGGVMMGCIMALITFLITWPPTLDFVTAGGIGLIVIIINTLLTSTKPKQESGIFEHFPVLLSVPEPELNDYEI